MSDVGIGQAAPPLNPGGNPAAQPGQCPKERTMFDKEELAAYREYIDSQEEAKSAEFKAALASVKVPCGKPHRTLAGLLAACGEEGALCLDCGEEAALVLHDLRHC